MRTIKVEKVEDSSLDIYCDGKLTHRIRQEADRVRLVDMSRVKEKAPPPDGFASQSGALAHLMHELAGNF